MGVPKFFRFISERYPCISELLQKDTQVCDFDYLYLDLNGIIHMCSHPDDRNPHVRINEEKLFSDIFHYITFLFQLIGPKKVFFLAIDGVAPRAKMNQQRSRRFCTARETQQLKQKSLEKGEKVPEGPHFDSNCITPGTVFMTKLHEQLRFFIKRKISTDKSWASCKVILSGHETPGEGEHKIMDYIRYLRSKPDHEPNSRHCLYGLDADLIMLGFCTHEHNFSILREEVLFSKNAVKTSKPDDKNFYLLHLSLLRDYIEEEFLILKTTLKFPFDIDKIVDDWVLLTFLVGNDFIPNLPNLAINNNALPELYEIYKTVLPTLDGYINENGILNLERFEIYMKSLSALDKNQFQETYADLKYFEGKTSKKVTKNAATFDVDLSQISMEPTNAKNSVFHLDLEELISSTEKMALDPDEDFICWNSDEEKPDYDSGEDMFDTEFSLHKRDYYMTKLDYASVTEDVLKSQAEGYVRALQWILHYYYQGCSSWSWFYPHHYAPYVSDVTNFKNMKIDFEMGKPFKPYEQLLAVLPVSSKDLLPEAFHHLMTSSQSPIIHYYPENFETDLNGKVNEWEAVVLLPFIDEETLLSAMEPCYNKLSEDDFNRNKHGPIRIYQYTPNNLGKVYSPAYFAAIDECHALEISAWSEDFVVPYDKVVRGTLPNKYRFSYFPGVPTLKHIKFETEFLKAKVRVFDRPSRNESAILHLKELPIDQKLEIIAPKLLGKIVWSGWPYISQSKITAVSDENSKFTYVPTEKHERLEDDEISSICKVDNKDEFASQRSISRNHYMSRLGVDVGDVPIMVHANIIRGYKYVLTNDGRLVYGVDWCSNSVPYPLKTILRNVEIAPIAAQKPYQTIEEAFPKGDKVFVIAGLYYGCMAEITDNSEIAKTGRMKVLVSQEPEPIIRAPSKLAINFYMPARVASARCGISSLLFARITSSLYVSKEKALEKKYDRNINIGLMMKQMKSNVELVGFTHKTEKIWLYSSRCIQVVNDYIFQFETMFRNLHKLCELDNVPETELFRDADYGVNEVSEWLKTQNYNKFPNRPCGSIGLDPEEMQDICSSVESQSQSINDNKKIIGIKVKPHVLFKENLRKGNIPPDFSCTEFSLFDRVVNINSNSSVPLGYKGTIVSVMDGNKQNSVKLTENIDNEPMYNVMFDKPFHSGGNICEVEGNRFYAMHGFNLLNITVGQSKHCKNQIQKPLVQPQIGNINNILSNNHNSAFAHYSSPTRDSERAANKQYNPRPKNQPIQLLPNSAPYPPIPNVNAPIPSMTIPFLNPTLNQIPPIMNPIPYHPAEKPLFIPQFRPQLPNQPPIMNSPIIIKDPPHIEEGTLALKSLLKLDQDQNFDTPSKPQRMNDSFIKSQEFYKTPPSNIQPPFPGKLIFNSNTQPLQPADNLGLPNKTVLPHTSFVPLQVTKKSLSMTHQSQQPPIDIKKNNNVRTPIDNSIANIPLPPQIVQQPAYVPMNSVPMNNKKSRSRKSRMAANFNVNQKKN